MMVFIENHMGLFEGGLIFGGALALGLWELFSVRRALQPIPGDGRRNQVK